MMSALLPDKSACIEAAIHEVTRMNQSLAILDIFITRFRVIFLCSSLSV
jgi:hypothetical protein